MSDLTTTMPPAPAAEPIPQFQQVTKTGTNGLAVTSFVLSLLWFGGLGSILAIIFGVIGRKQVKESGQGGGGLATAGLVIGIVGVVGAVVLWAIVIAAGAAAGAAASDANTAIDAYTRCIDAAQTAAQVSAC
jgi:uncharacterized protein DUF4190